MPPESLLPSGTGSGSSQVLCLPCYVRHSANLNLNMYVYCSGMQSSLSSVNCESAGDSGGTSPPQHRPGEWGKEKGREETKREELEDLGGTKV